MAKILSQNEIDSLLGSIADAGEPEVQHESLDEDRLRPMAVYDFRHPSRVSKDQIRTLETIHENFANQLSSSLSTFFRTMVEVELVSVDQIAYGEFILSLSTPSCSYTIEVDPLPANWVLDLNPDLTSAFVDRSFGGSGHVVDLERELTGIEKGVINRIADRLCIDLERSWHNIAEVNVGRGRLETNSQFLQVIPPGEAVIIVSCRIKLAQSVGQLTVCYPYVSLEPVISQLSAQNWIDSTDDQDHKSNRAVNAANLRKVETDVTVVLLETNLSVQEFMRLRVGDLIHSQKKITKTADLCVGRKKRFDVRPGLAGKQRAVLIVGACNETDSGE